MKSRNAKSRWIKKMRCKTDSGESCWKIRDGAGNVKFTTSELNKVFEEFIAAKWQKRSNKYDDTR